MEKPNVAMPKIGGNPLVFFREVKSELLKVSWPSRQQTIKLTGTVVLISAVVGLFVGGLDFIFTNIMNFLVKR